MATFHYVPLHTSEAASRFFAAPALYPVTEDVSGRLIRPPYFIDITEPTMDRVIDELLAALDTAHREPRSA